MRETIHLSPQELLIIHKLSHKRNLGYKEISLELNRPPTTIFSAIEILNSGIKSNLNIKHNNYRIAIQKIKEGLGQKHTLPISEVVDGSQSELGSKISRAFQVFEKDLSSIIEEEIARRMSNQIEERTKNKELTKVKKRATVKRASTSKLKRHFK